jgi:hypothetical protein
MATFGEGEQQRHEERAQHEPRRHVHVDRRAARIHAQQEADRDAHRVEHDDVLELDRIGDVDHPVDRRPDQEVAAPGQREPHAHERQGRNARDADRQTPARQRTFALLGMLLVPLEIEQVVHQIDRAGDEAEAQEGQRRFAGDHRFAHLLGEDQRREDQEVLDPLVKAHGFEECEEGLHGSASGWGALVASSAVFGEARSLTDLLGDRLSVERPHGPLQFFGAAGALFGAAVPGRSDHVRGVLATPRVFGPFAAHDAQLGQAALTEEALAEHEIGRASRARKEPFGEFACLRALGIGGRPRIEEERRAARPHDAHELGPCLRVSPRVLARRVERDVVMGGLEDGDAQAAPGEHFDDGAEQRGLARARRSHESEAANLEMRGEHVAQKDIGARRSGQDVAESRGTPCHNRPRCVPR